MTTTWTLRTLPVQSVDRWLIFLSPDYTTTTHHTTGVYCRCLPAHPSLGVVSLDIYHVDSYALLCLFLVFANNFSAIFIIRVYFLLCSCTFVIRLLHAFIQYNTLSEFSSVQFILSLCIRHKGLESDFLQRGVNHCNFIICMPFRYIYCLT